jgi:hypothetical protein
MPGAALRTSPGAPPWRTTGRSASERQRPSVRPALRLEAGLACAGDRSNQGLTLERIPWPLRSPATCGNGGPHSAEPSIPDKDEVPGSSPDRLTIQHHRSERRGRRSFSGPCSTFGPRRALLDSASFSSPGAPGRPWTAVPYPGGWAGSSRRRVPEAAAAAQPPWGPVPARPVSVGVTVVEGGRCCSRSASGPRPNRCTKSAPWRRRLLAGDG